MEAIKLSIVLAIIITSIVILHFLTHRKEDLNDDVILFPILAETEGLGSLAEVGFSIIQIIKSGGTKNIIVMIDDDCTVKDVAVREASIRMRALVKAHLKKLNYPNVYLVDYLIDMYKLSLELHAIETLRAGLDQYRAK